MYIPTPIFSDRLSYRLRNVALFMQCSARVGLRRIVHGARFDWDYLSEAAAEFLRKQTETSYRMPPEDGREFSRAFTFASPVSDQVHVEMIRDGALRGRKFTPKENLSPVTLLFLHGGGFFYGSSNAYATMAALFAVTMRATTYMPDYHLAPEYPFPTALDDALAAYRALLDLGLPPSKVILCGDSAGGNLVMALLLALREHHLPQPGLAIPLCPWVDLTNSGESMRTNDPVDWIFFDMLEKCARAYTNGHDRRDPRLSPAFADYAETAPIYIQTGRNEVLYDQIMAFYERAKTCGWDVTLDEFDNAIHDLQAWGELTHASREALKRLAERAALI